MKKPEGKRKGIFLTIDAFYALTIAMLLAGAVLVFSQAHEPQLIQLHQLGRDYLVVQYKHGIPFAQEDFNRLTGLNSSPAEAQVKMASRVIVYPELCADPPKPQCFQAQDIADSGGLPKILVYNATVSE